MTVEYIEEQTVLKQKGMNTDTYYDEKDYLNFHCEKEFAMYYSGWECDSRAWVMEDGTIFTTNHGRLCVMSRDDFDAYRIKMIGVVEELNELNKRLKND